MAAGQSKRMGFPKLSAELVSGLPLGGAALLELLKLGLEPLIVVVRPSDTLDWLPNLENEGSAEAGYKIAVCTDAHEGMSRSIQCALREIAACSHEAVVDAVLITLADNPFITSALLLTWLSVFKEDPSLDYIATERMGNPMPPVLWNRSVFEELEKLEGDAGGRQLFHSDKYRGLLISVDEDTASDVDTPSDLARVRERWIAAGKEIEPAASYQAP